jgi:hypothetical protein
MSLARVLVRPAGVSFGLPLAALAVLFSKVAFRRALALAIGLRVALGLAGWEVLRLTPPTFINGEWTALLLPRNAPLYGIVGLWQRWDGLWYERLASAGYRYGGPDIEFFPLYPGLVHVAGVVFGGAYALAGLFVSTVAFIIALVLLHQLVEIDFGGALAARTVRYLALAPLAFFFFAPYTESLFLALSLGVFLAARRGHFGLAGVLAGAAAVCRLQGILLIVPLAVEIALDVSARRGASRAPLSRSALFKPGYLAACLPVLTLGAFFLYGRTVVGVPGSFIEAGAVHWGHHVVGPWTAIADSVRVAFGTQRPEEIINLATVLFAVAALPWIFRQMRWSYGAYCLVMLVPVLFQEAYLSPLMSASRYLLVLFPLFILAARLGRKGWFDRAVLVISPTLMGALFASFVRFAWIA